MRRLVRLGLALAISAVAVPAAANGLEIPENGTEVMGRGGAWVARADNPLVFASPTGLSFGFVLPGASVVRQVALSDAGGGAGSWDVSATLQQTANSASVSVLPTTTVPGQLVVTAAAAPGAPQATHTGFIVLSRGSITRRIPFWFRVAAPALATEPATPLTKTGTYHGDTRGRPSLVDTGDLADLVNPARSCGPPALSGGRC
jgi:hypothetical protein